MQQSRSGELLPDNVMKVMAAYTGLFGFVFLAVGLFVVVQGVHEAMAGTRFVQETQSAVAVVERVQVYGWDDGPFHDAWVRFTTDQGQEIQTQVRQTRRGLLIADPTEGGTVTVRYYPHDPSTAWLSPSRRESPRILFFVLGAGFIAIGIHTGVSAFRTCLTAGRRRGAGDQLGAF